MVVGEGGVAAEEVVEEVAEEEVVEEVAEEEVEEQPPREGQPTRIQSY